MGSWFSNLNIRKSDTVNLEATKEQLIRWMQTRQYEMTDSAEEADGVLVILTAEDSEWITVCTDLVALEEPEQSAELGAALSEALCSDALGIACFDSDYLWMNLRNAQEQIDGWVGIGSGKELGFTRRNKLTPWKKKVSDYARFAQCAKEDYIIADGFLMDTADCLGLPHRLSNASVRYMKDIDPEGKATYLYFRQQDNTRAKEKVRMAHYDSGLPCLVGYESYLQAINLGLAGTGLRIWFLVPCVETDEVTFDNVRLRIGNNEMPLVLTKAQLEDGRWAWCWHDPELSIPPAVTGRMKKEKRWELERQRQFTVLFTPRGNSRKTLDIQIGFVPDENPEGGTWWYVWRKYGSKEAFIKNHNKTWKWCWSMKDPEDDERGYLPLLKLTDFD